MPYTIITYDVEQKRVARICKFLRRFLNWTQNSVFEGEISPAKLEKIKIGIKKIIKTNQDSVYIFKLHFKESKNKEIIGVEKNPQENIL